MVDPTEVFQAANNILTAIENTFNSAGVDLPARRYITLGGQGTVAYDCAQLTVSWERNYYGLPGNQLPTLTNCYSMTTGVFIIELVRDIPVSQRAEIPPEVGLIQDSAEGLLQDAALLSYSGKIAVEGNEIFDKGLVSVTSGAPAGAVQAILMVIEMVV